MSWDNPIVVEVTADQIVVSCAGQVIVRIQRP